VVGIVVNHLILSGARILSLLALLLSVIVFAFARRMTKMTKTCSLGKCKEYFDRGDREMAVASVLRPMVVPPIHAVVGQMDVASSVIDGNSERLELLKSFTREYGDTWHHLISVFEFSLENLRRLIRTYDATMRKGTETYEQYLEARFLFGYVREALKRINRFENRKSRHRARIHGL
jgi:hypothetical protein